MDVIVEHIYSHHDKEMIEHNLRSVKSILNGPYLSVIDFACAKQSTQRVITGDSKPSDVDQEFTGNIEEN